MKEQYIMRQKKKKSIVYYIYFNSRYQAPIKAFVLFI